MEKYIRLFIVGLLLLSCDVTDDELILLEPTLELWYNNISKLTRE